MLEDLVYLFDLLIAIYVVHTVIQHMLSMKERIWKYLKSWRILCNGTANW